MEKKLRLGLTILGPILVIAIGALLFLSPKSPTTTSQQNPAISPIPTPTPEQPTSDVPPTLSPQEIKIISKIKTYTVTIKNNSFTPQTLTIKQYDQVQWENETNETFQIKGDGWGNVPIAAGERFSQDFKTTGTFAYTCTLHPELTGTIVVTE